MLQVDHLGVCMYMYMYMYKYTNECINVHLCTVSQCKLQYSSMACCKCVDVQKHFNLAELLLILRHLLQHLRQFLHGGLKHIEE